MATATGFSSQQQFTDVVDNSAQQTPMLQPSPLETPPFVEPSINYPCYPSTSNATTNNLDNNPPVTTTNNYSSRSVFVGYYPQQQQPYLEHNYQNCPTSHLSHPPVTSDNNVHSHQSVPNNASTSQYPQQYPQQHPQQYSQYIDQNPLQNVFPHSLNITINTPQTNIIYIMSSDMQNQLLQGRTYSPSDIINDNSQTQLQQ